MDKIEKVLKIVASSVATVVPCILLAGFSYHLGYINSFGLSDELIHKSMSDVLVESWYVGVMSIAWILSFWKALVGWFIFYLFLGVGFLLLFRKLKSEGATWIFDEITKENQGRTIVFFSQWHWMCLGGLISDLSLLFFIPLVLVAALGLLMALPYQEGNDNAVKQLDAFRHNGCEVYDKSFSCISLIDTLNHNNLIAKGILVSSNKDRIAVFNKKLEVWPLLDSYIIEKEEPVSDVGDEKEKLELDK